MEPYYPDITVQLTGENGNAFNIIGIVCRALHRAGVHPVVMDFYCEESMRGDYQNVLHTAMQWVEVE